MILGAAVSILRLHGRACQKCERLALPRTFKQYFHQGLLSPKLSQPLQVSRSFSSWRSAVLNRSWRIYTTGWNNSGRKITSNSCNIFKRFNCTKAPEINPLLVNTNVKNNVMLFKYEKDTLMRLALIFGFVATFGCLFMADSVYMLLVKDLFNQKIPLKTRIWDNLFPLSAIAIAVVAGPLMIVGAWIIIIRTIKYIILLKGGKEVTIVTYHPIFKHKKMTVPTQNVNCQVSRQDGKSYAMIKIKDYKIRYYIDKSGDFVNPELFDCTVGASRN